MTRDDIAMAQLAIVHKQSNARRYQAAATRKSREKRALSLIEHTKAAKAARKAKP